MSYTLYISDLDGTLLNQDAELSAYTKDTLNRLLAEGLPFTVATARTGATVARILDGVDFRLPVILMNGVLIYDLRSKKHLRICPVGPVAMSKVVAVLKEYDATGFVYEIRDDKLATYYESLERKPLRDFHDERVARYQKAFVKTESFAALSHEHIVYVSLLDEREKLLPVHEALSGVPDLSMALYRDIYSPALWYLELYSDRASKKNAALFLKEYGRFDRLTGFGDNLNDLPLFETCAECCAVANARPEVKEAATRVIGSNTEDGVARWLSENYRG